MTGWMGLDPDDKTAILIDGANLYKTARTLGFDIDYKRLLKKARSESRLVRACYYTAIPEEKDQEFSPLRPLIDWLDYNGYHMVTKTGREFCDSSGKKRFRGSIDVELSIDMVQLAQHLDCIVLFTGNGDLKYAIAKAQEVGCRVVCVSTTMTNPAMVADDLRRQADMFIDLTELEEVLSRKEGPPRKEEQSNGQQQHAE